jgi:uncharacterized protein YoxC
MDELLKISGLLAILSFIVLAVIAILTLLKTGKLIENITFTINKLTNDISEIKTKSLVLFDDMHQLKLRIDKTLDELSTLKIQVGTSLENFNDMSRQITGSIQNIERRTDKFIAVMEPIENFVGDVVDKVSPTFRISSTFISAMSKAIGAFTAKILKK